MANYTTEQYNNARSGIWYRAKRTANPKGTILKMQAMNGSKPAIRAYNDALKAAKAWAKSKPLPEATVKTNVATTH